MEGVNDGANLVGIDDVAVELFGGIIEVFLLGLPALAARQALTLLNLLVRLEFAAMAGLLRVDDIDFIADIDTISDGLFMVVFADDVLFEESVGAVIRRSSQADEVGIEILQNLKPYVVNRAMALVDNDKVKEFRRILSL